MSADQEIKIVIDSKLKVPVTDIQSLRLAFTPENLVDQLKIVSLKILHDPELKDIYPFRDLNQVFQSFKLLQICLDFLLDDHNQQEKDKLFLLPLHDRQEIKSKENTIGIYETENTEDQTSINKINCSIEYNQLRFVLIIDKRYRSFIGFEGGSNPKKLYLGFSFYNSKVCLMCSVGDPYQRSDSAAGTYSFASMIYQQKLLEQLSLPFKAYKTPLYWYDTSQKFKYSISTPEATKLNITQQFQHKKQRMQINYQKTKEYQIRRNSGLITGFELLGDNQHF